MKRSFSLGSEWLYYKIYTGVNTADYILTEKLNPVIESLLENKTISKWFFIRYNDPDDHIRIRFNCESVENVTEVIKKLYPIFDELIESDVIWKLQTDTYQREIERYGAGTIMESESIFYFDSEMILNYVALKQYFEKEETQLLFSFLAIDSFLNSFHLTINDKLLLLDNLQESFKKEFNVDKQLKKEFDKNYRELSVEIDALLSKKVDNEFAELFEAIYEKQCKVNLLVPSIKSNIQIPLNSFLVSHIHMMINRQYQSKQRTYECLIYDHMYRYYKMVSYKNSN
ncbi:thiopeptide-type bacteriocin biosynthesis protein [Flavobacterium sp.]|uniref:thiopeptide-type bacteriocin biosynthesis protein n=1 Tax=Flavobacterium sp. TaxID=239 RepID=UPI0025C19168|nr:thiopeptide-type bacteriocin biosynthesis protein [Flavobacterium sp.]